MMERQTMERSNSSVKDTFQRQNYESAKQTEKRNLEHLEQDSKDLISKKKKEKKKGYLSILFVIPGLIVFLILFDILDRITWNIETSDTGDIVLSLLALLVSVLAGYAVYTGLNRLFVRRINKKTARYNDSIDRNVRHLQQEAQEKTRQAYEQAAQATKQQVASYEAEVRQITKKILTNPSAIAPMKDFLFDKLEQAISRANMDSTVPEISADLTYTVETEGIKTASDYYSFQTNQYAPLDNDMKCEALAIALRALVDHEMKTQYPNDVFQIRATQAGTEITLYFSASNPNYIQPTAIF